MTGHGWVTHRPARVPLERAVVDAAIQHVLAQRRLLEAMQRDVDPYWDVKVSDALKARDDARAVVEAAVDAVIAQRQREAR